MRAALYLRISYDPRGEAAGVDRQRADCMRLAEGLGWQVTEVFEDNDSSAYSGRTRPAYEAMLLAMRRREVDAVIAWHTDRLHRSMKDLVRFIDAAKAGEISIRTVQGGDLDLSTASGVMLAQILGAVAEQESAHHAERRRRANDERAAAGEWRNQGKIPFGYTKEGEPVPAEAASIRQGLADGLAGVTLRQIARDWNAAGHLTRTLKKPFTSTVVKRLLMNPRYAGLVVHRGQIIGNGKWEPIVDRDDQLAFIAIATDPARVSNATGYERKFQGTGAYLCGVCGGRCKIHVADRRRSYVCRQSQHVRRSQHLLDDYIDKVMASWIERQELNVDRDDGELRALVLDRSGLIARQDAIADSFATGQVTITQMERATAKLTEQIKGLDMRIAMLRSGSSVVATNGEPATDVWKALSPDTRSKIIADVLEVRIMPAPIGTRGLDIDRIELKWKDLA